VPLGAKKTFLFPAYVLTYFIGRNEGAIIKGKDVQGFSKKFLKVVLCRSLIVLANEILAINLTYLGSPVNGPPRQLVVNTIVGGQKGKRKPIFHSKPL
jgi:hypothetical protein